MQRAVEALKRGILCTGLQGVYHPATHQDPYGHGLWAWDGGPFRGEYLEYQPKYLNVVNRLVSAISPFSDTTQGVRYYPGDTPRQPGPSHPGITIPGAHWQGGCAVPVGVHLPGWRPLAKAGGC